MFFLIWFIRNQSDYHLIDLRQLLPLEGGGTSKVTSSIVRFSHHPRDWKHYTSEPTPKTRSHPAGASTNPSQRATFQNPTSIKTIRLLLCIRDKYVWQWELVCIALVQLDDCRIVIIAHKDQQWLTRCKQGLPVSELFKDVSCLHSICYGVGFIFVFFQTHLLPQTYWQVFFPLCFEIFFVLTIHISSTCPYIGAEKFIV